MRIVVKNKDKYLLIKEVKANYNQWNFPGGKIDEDEAPILAAVRELKEEVNLNADTLTPLIEFEYQFNNGLWYGYYFIVQNLNMSDLKVMEVDKCDGYCFFKLEEIERLDLNMPMNVFLALKNHQ